MTNEDIFKKRKKSNILVIGTCKLKQGTLSYPQTGKNSKVSSGEGVGETGLSNS